MKKIAKRFKNPFFLFALAGLIYHALEQAGIKIQYDTFKAIVDVISYPLIGIGIYKTFDDGSEENE